MPVEENSKYRSLRERLKELENDLDEYKTRGLRNVERHLEMSNVSMLHADLQLILSKHLIKDGYRALVESPIKSFICDIVALRDSEKFNIEIETGLYNIRDRDFNMEAMIREKRARTISKAARYSHLSYSFGFGVPPNYSIQMPREFSRLPEERRNDKIAELKGICDAYYRNPPISYEQIKNAVVDFIFIIDPINSTVTKKSTKDYIEACSVF